MVRSHSLRIRTHWYQYFRYVSTMLLLVAVFILSCSTNSLLAATPYKDCGSESGTIQMFQVTDCDVAPCKLARGKTYAMNLTMQAKAPSATATVAIYGEKIYWSKNIVSRSNSIDFYLKGVIGGVPIPFPLPETNACKLGVACPVKASDVDVATFSVPVLASYPTLSLYVKIEIKDDDQKNDYVCLLFPATITN